MKATELQYGDQFVYDGNRAKEAGKSFPIEQYKALIFIKMDGDRFMYASMAGQHTRDSEALEYCTKI